MGAVIIYEAVDLGNHPGHFVQGNRVKKFVTKG